MSELPSVKDGQSFNEWLGQRGGGAFDVFAGLDLNALSRDTRLWTDAPADTVEGEDTYAWKPGQKNRRTLYSFPEGTDRLRTFAFAVYDHKGGEGDYEPAPEPEEVA